MNTTPDIASKLAEIGDDYTYRINMLLDEGREDLAAKLSDQYTEESARVLLSQTV